MLQQQATAQKIETCRSCNGPIEPLISLGDQYIIDFPLPNHLQTKAPLDLVKCKTCQLVQLAHTVPRNRLFSNFWYQSGISKSMTASLKEIVNEAIGLVKLEDNDVVLDIGSNDGTLLQQYPPGPWLCGFEPAANVAIKSQEFATVVLKYFNAEDYRMFGKRAKIITSIAMFYDLTNPGRFVSDITKCLDHQGVWIVQMNYLPAMLQNNCYDNICHEHLEYYSLSSLKALVEPYGLEIFRVQENNVNGGSFRVHIGFAGTWPIEQSVYQMLDSELQQDLDQKTVYRDFKKRITEETWRLWDFIVQQTRSGSRKIYVYGASTRGTVILQHAKLDRMLLPKACDANPDKWGRVMVGANIPIISKEEARKDRPDWWLVLPYHFLDEIIEEEGSGKYLVPLPTFRAVIP